MALTLMRLNGTAIREASSGSRAPALCQRFNDIYIYKYIYTLSPRRDAGIVESE